MGGLRRPGLRALADLERVLHRNHRAGPVRVRYVDQGRGGVRAEGAGGVTATIPVSTLPGRAAVAAELAAGVEVAVDGEPVLLLRQARHGLGRRARVLEVIDLGRGWVPPGAWFRARGLSGNASLEAEGRILVRVREPWFTTVVAPGVPDELVVVHAAVAVGLGEAVRL